MIVWNTSGTFVYQTLSLQYTCRYYYYDVRVLLTCIASCVALMDDLPCYVSRFGYQRLMYGVLFDYHIFLGGGKTVVPRASRIARVFAQ